MMGNAVVVKQSFLQSQRDFLRNFLRAIGEAQVFVLSPIKQQSVLKVLTKRLSITDPAVAEDALQDLLSGRTRSRSRRSRRCAISNASYKHRMPRSGKSSLKI
jgi:hypothetical protein